METRRGYKVKEAYVRARAAVFHLSVVLCVAGCGYRIGNINPDDPIKRIAIPTFKNSSTEPGIQTRATNDIVTQFQIDGAYEIVEKGQADAVLEGDIIGYYRDALRFTDNDVTREYRLTVQVSLKLVDARTGDLIWRAHNVEGETTFFINISLPEDERRALPDALKDLAQHVVERTVERW